MSSVTEWIRGLWEFYLAYTKTGAHAAATAGLAIFGLLMFVDDAFALFAIASYVFPPVILYVLADEPPETDGPADGAPRGVETRDRSRVGGRASPTEAKTMETTAVSRGRPFADERLLEADGDANSDGNDADADSDSDPDRDDGDTDTGCGDGDTDSDSDDGDTDSDSDDGDTDSDSDDGDTDTDSDDGDTDSDGDDGDTDSDSDDGDMDSDSDNGDTDSDSDDGDTDSDSDS